MRELRNVIEQAVLLAQGNTIAAHELMLSKGAAASVSTTAVASIELPPSDAAGAGSALDRIERELLVKALADSNQNVSQAARTLGISRDTLRYRLEKHGLRA